MIHIEDQELLQLLPFFLTGIAARWYESHQAQWRSFDEFSYACRTRFSDPDFQFELIQENHKRTQGENEPVADYLTCVLTMFDKLSPHLSQSDEISFAYRNLLPRLQLAITRSSIHTIAQLEETAVAAEKSIRVAKSFRPPPRPERSLLPDLAYRDPNPRPLIRKKVNLTGITEEESEPDSTDEVLLVENLKKKLPKM